MANLNILSRMNVVEFLKSKNATRLDYIPCKGGYEDGSAKFFFALNNSEKSIVGDREVIGTRGAISKSLAKDIADGKSLSINDVVVADTVMEGSSNHVWMLMRASESNSKGGFQISQF